MSAKEPHKEHVSTTDSSFTLSYAALQQQGLALLKETQDYTVRAAELAMQHPFLRVMRSTPTTADFIDATFGVATQALELQRDFVTRLGAVATK